MIEEDGWWLAHEATGAPAYEGEEVKTFRGEWFILEGGRPPRHQGSTGRVWFGGGEYYPSVVGLKWIQR